MNQLEQRIKELEKQIERPDFWKNKEAGKIYQEYSQLKRALDNPKELEKYKKEMLFSGKYDKLGIILTIEAGAGGRDAEDWASMLLKMYQRWAERNNFSYRMLFQKFGEGGGPEGRIGIKQTSMEIKGKYGLLKKENGVHRLVRISPFSAKKLRHTSFARVEVMPKIEKQSLLIIKPEDLKIETFRASGPGGQHVNRRETAVRITHLPTNIRAESQVERFQAMNKKIAMQVLISKLVKLKEEAEQKEIEKIKGEKKAVDFGSQIRSYTLHPYKLVKDHRTKIETSKIEDVLDGDLSLFIQHDKVSKH